MSSITKKIDRNIESGYQYWKSDVDLADDGTAIATADVFKITDSLGRPAHYMYLETTAPCTLSIRLNSQVTIYPLRADRLNYPRLPDLANPVTYTDSSMTAIPISDGAASEVYEINSVLPISDIQITNLAGAGSFELLVV